MSLGPLGSYLFRSTAKTAGVGTSHQDRTASASRPWIQEPI